ncbi:rod shape-determining protein MreC [Candidatus Kaiserbacteria bacterium]|nr:rod shape-determining protein MreC [Candidatus Kaiserbacteria bacterium]
MMNSYRQNKGRNGRVLAATALVLLLFILDVFTGGSIRHKLRGGAVVVSQWSGRALTSIRSSGILSTRASLEAQNRSLAEELAQFEERAGGYEALRAENEQLRALVRLVGVSLLSAQGVTAPVVSSVRTSPYGTFLIGAGAEDGIARGSLVLTGGGFVVGKVTDTGDHTAVVAEIFAPGASIDAVIGSAAISAQGSGGGNARAKVPRALTIHINQPVTAPELGARPIGIVGSIASSSASAFQDVFIMLPVNLHSLTYVYILPISD